MMALKGYEIERTDEGSARLFRIRDGRACALGLAGLFLALAAHAAPPPRQGKEKIAEPVSAQLRQITPLPCTLPACDPSKEPATGGHESPTPLVSLVAEARKNSPEVIAALRAWQAAEQVPSQVSTLPDPEVMVQHVSAGTPIPGWDFNTVPMAFVGVGISQDIPYPGKLRLRGEEARRQAAAMQQGWALAKRTVAQQVKIAYYRLSYVQKTLDILARDQRLIRQIEEIAEARYRVGQGNQQDVLKAQLEETRLVRDRTEYQEQRDSLEAQLKQILNRPPESADIVASTLVETPLPFTSDALLSLVRTGDPEVTAQQQIVRRRAVGVQIARKDFYPDFSFQYMYEQTGSETPNRYALTFGVKIPIYRSRRQEPELAQAAETLDQARRQYEGQVQQAYFEVQDQYLNAEVDSKVLKIYIQGLIPQATATFQAGLAAYQSGREDFQTLLDSFLDVLNLDTEYWRTLADHESALARLEQLTGISLP
jgi:cobalt-zinc-cadmium efflux system outer membrane protein